jgi:hypothetical protein
VRSNYQRRSWLVLAPILFNLMELVIHGLVAPRATRSGYNPGLASCLPSLALSVWYIVEGTRNGLATGPTGESTWSTS